LVSFTTLVLSRRVE